MDPSPPPSSLGKTYQINEGDVTEIKKTKIRICENGKSVLKKKEEVKPPYKYGCNGCTYNGKIVCRGTEVKDLYRWWFLAVCDKGRMNPVGRSWLEVSQDTRYKNSVQ